MRQSARDFHRDGLPIQRNSNSPRLLYKSGTGVMPVVVVLPLKFVVDKRLRKQGIPA